MCTPWRMISTSTGEGDYELRGERTGKTYRLGQRVRIQVKAADRLCRTIDFSLAESNAD